MKGGRTSGWKWYRSHWRTVATVWGILLGLLLAISTFYWWVFMVLPRQGHKSNCGDAHRVEPSADYPLTRCVVSGKPLGASEARVAVDFDGVEIQLCCSHCLREFNRDPSRFAAQVREAQK